MLNSGRDPYRYGAWGRMVQGLPIKSENVSMEVAEMLRRAADLVPLWARSDAGLTADDVRDYLRESEWEDALGILADFDGVH